MLKEIERLILENGPRWEIPFSPPRTLYFTKTGGSKGDPAAQPVVFLLFDQNSATPRWVVKVSRNRATIPILTKEYENLLYFYHRFPSSFRSTLPKPLLSREDPGRFLFVESGLRGKRISPLVQPDGDRAYRRAVGKMFEDVLAWLGQFQKETYKGAVEVTEAWIEEEVKGTIEQYRIRYSVDISEEDFLNDHLERWKEWKKTAIPITGQHGDFRTENIFADGHAVSICDWSLSQKKGRPFDDLFCFLSSLSVGAEEGNPIDSFENLYFEENWFRQQAREIVARFFFRWELSPRLFSQLYPLFLIKQSIREAGGDSLHAVGDSVWRERLLFFIRNRSRFMEV